MKRETERRLERLEGGRDGQWWTEAEAWIVDGDTARNLDTGETITAADLESSRAKEGRLLVVHAIVASDGEGRPKEAAP